MKRLYFIFLLACLSSCGSGNDGSASVNENRVFISDIGIYDENGPIKVVDAASLIDGGATVRNGTQAIFSGFIEIYIDTTCEGVSPWQFRELDQIEISPKTAIGYAAGRSCSDLKPSNTSIVVTVYGPDQTEVIDRQTYEFAIR